MSLKEKLTATFKGITATVSEGTYTGSNPEYITFNYTLLPADFGDDEPGAYRALIQAHYFAPPQKKSLAVRREIARRIVLAGFNAPEITPASDGTGQHWAFEFEDVVTLEEVLGIGEIEHNGA